MSNPSPTPVIHRPAGYRAPSALRSWLISRPLPTADPPDQAIRKRIALAVFASDALSSTAYATQEMHPLVSYIAEAAEQCERGEVITVVVPQFVPAKAWENLLHMQTAEWLRWALFHLKNVIDVDVPYVLE